MNYAEKYKQPLWQRRRLEIMSRDGFKCCSCGESDSTLAVHHMYYVHGRDPWEYPNWSLVTLCEPCHQTWHKDTKGCGDGVSYGEEWELAIERIVLGASIIGPACEKLAELGAVVITQREKGISIDKIVRTVLNMEVEK